MDLFEKIELGLKEKKAELNELADALKEGGELGNLKALFNSREDLRSIIEFYASPIDAPFMNTKNLAEVVNRLFVRFWTRVEADPEESKQLRELAQKLTHTLEILDPKRPTKLSDDQKKTG